MDRILIKGGVPLEGTVEISGAKNAALPIMCASLLSAEPLDLANVPDLADIASTQKLLQHLGVSATHVAGAADRMVLHAPRILTDTAPYDLVRKMRASVLVLGPLLARTGAAKVSLPGGCAIGPRPIDLHLMGMERLGATIELEGGYVHATAPNGLIGARDPPAEPLGRCHREPADGGVPGQGRDADRRGGARARDRRSGGLPDRDGGQDRGCRHQQHPHRGRAGVARRQPCDHPRPDRGRDLRHGGRGHRRQHRAQERPAGLLRRRQGGDRGRGHGAGAGRGRGAGSGRPMAGSRAATP